MDVLFTHTHTHAYIMQNVFPACHYEMNYLIWTTTNNVIYLPYTNFVHSFVAFSLSLFHAGYLNYCPSHLFLIRRQDFSHVSWHHWFNRVMRLPVLFWKSNRSASCYFCTELLRLDLAVKFMWEQTEWMENRRHGRCCMWMCWFWMSLIQSQFLKAALSSAPLSEFFNGLSEHMAWLRWLNLYANSLGWKITFTVGIAREILQMFLRGSKTKAGHSKHSHQSRPFPSACSQVTLSCPLCICIYMTLAITECRIIVAAAKV